MTSRLLERQRKSFDALVEQGVYDAQFDHPPKAKSFVASVLESVGPRLPRHEPLTVLDCGCGTGAWLSFLQEWLARAGRTNVRLCGFDLSPRMVEAARVKLEGLAAPQDLRSGNLLEQRSYAFEGVSAGFDLIFTYDVVQQVPRFRQVAACHMIVAALAPGGLALVFDNDGASRFGRSMAWRKFVTRYCGLRLVPRYYCNASYPPLERMREQLDSDPLLRAQIMVRADRVKRAMIVERHPDAEAYGASGTAARGWP